MKPWDKFNSNTIDQSHTITPLNESAPTPVSNSHLIQVPTTNTTNSSSIIPDVPPPIQSLNFNNQFQSNRPYTNQYSNPYTNQYTNQYSSQYTNQYSNPYSNQYSSFSNQYNNPYPNQYSSSFGNNQFGKLVL